jgi:selT/selW/selH-like putative selenoprotein
LDVSPELLPGERGVFDVVVDDETIFSKYASHRFPSHNEIIAALKLR